MRPDRSKSILLRGLKPPDTAEVMAVDGERDGLGEQRRAMPEGPPEQIPEVAAGGIAKAEVVEHAREDQQPAQWSTGQRLVMLAVLAEEGLDALTVTGRRVERSNSAR